MSKELLREFYQLCPDGMCLDILTESEKREMSSGKSMYLVGKCHEAERLNGNGREYPFEILRREVDRYMDTVKENRSLGELDHPDDSVVNLKNASHMMTGLWWEGKTLMGKLKVLSTPAGQTLRALVDDGVMIGISSRGLGSVRKAGDRVIVEDDFQLICFDVVSDPSTPKAYMDKVVRESKQRVETKNINSMLDEILKSKR